MKVKRLATTSGALYAGWLRLCTCRKIASVTVCVFCFFVSPHAARSAPEKVPEYHLKTAFLYNLAKFVDWPAGETNTASSVFRIGVIDDTYMRSAFQLIANKTVGGRPLALAVIASPCQADDCQMVFLNGRDTRQIQRVLERVRKHPILTVGELPEFIKWGGIIRFRMENDHVRLDASPVNGRMAGLTLKSTLLQLCRIVGATKPKGNTE